MKRQRIPTKEERTNRKPTPNQAGWELYLDFLASLRALNMTEREWSILTHQILDDISEEEMIARNIGD